jgi:hypothetical protein
VTRDEYLEMLATEPATATQVGAIIGEFRRLGIDNRDERLAISAELLELGGLGSTTDLVMGQAGRLVDMLRRTAGRAELPDVDQLDDEGQDDEDTADEGAHWPTFAEAIEPFVNAVAYLFGDRKG